MKNNGYRSVFILLNIVNAFSAFAQSSECAFALVNYDFETPVINTSFAIVNDTLVPGWSTTAKDHLIEIWGVGMHVPVYSGKQFVELNGTQVAALYQDVQTIPGSTLKIGFAHRGRLGTDVMELKIGPPTGPYISQGTYSDGNTKWGYYTVDYLVPAGQNVTRFYFSSVSSAGGNKAIGNFLDAINIQGVNVAMDAVSVQSCVGRIDVVPDVPMGIALTYSLDNLNFKKDSFFENLPSGNYTAYMNVGGVCTKQKSVSVNNFSKPLPELGPDQTICADGTKAIFDAGGAFSKYQWDSGETKQTISTAKAGQHKITVTDSHGCQASDSVNLSVNLLPVFDLGPDKSICDDGTQATFDAGLGFKMYSWNTGETTHGIARSQSREYIVHVTNTAGCVAVDSVFLNVNPSPQFSLGKDITICENLLPAQFGVSEIQGFTYKWNSGATAGIINTSVGGLYILKVTTDKGCSNVDSVLSVVKKLPVVNLGRDTIVCDAKVPIVLDAGSNMDSCKWNTGEVSQNINVFSTGSYSVLVSKNGCQKMASINVKVKSAPKLELQKEYFACEGDKVVISVNTNATNIKWSTNETTASINVFKGGPYFVNVSNDSTCVTSASTQVSFGQFPEKVLKDTIKVCFNETYSIKLNAKTNASIYKWMHDSGPSEYTVFKKGSYFVQLISAEGCITYDTTYVDEICTPDFYVPNTFTPNEDGDNDLFLAKCFGELESFRLQIFNRWGELFFEALKISDGWDGKLNGNLAPEGVYVWKIAFAYKTVNRRETTHLIGHVNLVR